METSTTRCVSAVEFGHLVDGEATMWRESFAPLFTISQDDAWDRVFIPGADMGAFGWLVVDRVSSTSFLCVPVGLARSGPIVCDVGRDFHLESA